LVLEITFFIGEFFPKNKNLKISKLSDFGGFQFARNEKELVKIARFLIFGFSV
jgi:hypothetical protein